MLHRLRKIKYYNIGWVICSSIFLVIIYFFLYKILMPRVLAFGCFDDCFNFMGGYFLLKGRHLYSEIFYNHQPFAAFISYFIQVIKHPQNIYELVLVHRQALLLFSFFMNLLLLIRFRWRAIGFILFYEFTKFYLFGDRFLAESFIVYPLIYVTGIVFYTITNKKIFLLDYVICALSTWFVVFMREPYIPLALFSYGILFVRKPFGREKKISIILFFVLMILTLLQFSLPNYFFNVVTVNQQTVLHSESAGIFSNPMNLLKIVCYPLFIFFTGPWNFFREILICIDCIFLVSLFFLFWKKRISKQYIVVLTIVLALANVRATDPGVVFYEGFHMLVWYSLFLFVTCSLITLVYKNNRRMAFIFYGIFLGIFGYFIFSGKSYINDHINPQTDLITNYGNVLQVGEVVRKLSNPSDTLFLDGFDDLIYWQADRISPYKYSWYTSFMHSIPMYSEAKVAMFATNPPDFYYGTCIKNVPYWEMPEKSKDQYLRFYTGNKPSCLYVNKHKLPEITQEQWKMAEEFGYSLKSNK